MVDSLHITRPVTCLPPEIWILLLDFTICFEDSLLLATACIKTLCSVCKLWEVIVKSQPSLWAFIDSGFTVDTWKEHLEISASHPLRVKIGANLPQGHEFLSAVEAALHRWETAIISKINRASDNNLYFLSDASAPLRSSLPLSSSRRNTSTRAFLRTVSAAVHHVSSA